MQQALMQVVEKAKSKVLQTSQEEKDLKRQQKSKKSTSKCEYGCDGSGLIINPENKNSARQCKCVEIEAKRIRLEKQLKFANIPEAFRDLKINDFDVNIYEKKESREKASVVKNAAVQFVKEYKRFEEVGKGLYLVSRKKGSGKTRMAISIANAINNVYDRGIKYTTVSDIAVEVKATFDRDAEITESELINGIREVDLLVIDDLGVENISNWTNSVLYSIINSRNDNQKVTIFTANNLIEDIRGYDDRLKSRISRMSNVIDFPEEDIRVKIGSKQSDELTELLFKGS